MNLMQSRSRLPHRPDKYNKYLTNRTKYDKI